MKDFTPTIVAISVLWTCGAAFAQTGGKIVRVDDAGVAERCIDPYKDKVWLTLRGLTATKSQGWFTKDKDVSVIINARVQTDPPPPTPISFPLMSIAKFGEGPNGQVSVPIEYSIVSGLVMRQDQIVYTGIGVEITLVNLMDRSKLGSALQALDTITSSAKLPIPAAPYVQAVTYLTGFANSAVQKDIDAQKNDKAVAGAMQFNFDPSGECVSGDFEKTGTKAIISSTGNASDPGYVNLNNIDQYCFRANLRPSFSLKTALRTSEQDCSKLRDTDFKSVSNNYIGLYLNKQAVGKGLGPSSVANRDRSESIKRCEVHGFERSACEAQFK